MRVTSKLFNDRFIANLNVTMNKVTKTQYQLSTGKKHELPSDAPASVPSIMRLRANIHKFNRYAENIASVKPRLNATENNLSDLFDLMTHSKELAINAANSTEDEGSRRIIAREVNQVLQRVFAIANSRHNGLSLFGGKETLTRPFTENGGQYEYNGSGGEITQVFSDGVSISINLTGNEVFQGNVITSSMKILPTLPLTIPAGEGDISFTIGDGINTSSVITFSEGSSYTQAQVLSQINGDMGNVSVSASFNSNGYLTLRSNVSDNIADLALNDLSSSGNNISLALGLSPGTTSGIDIFAVLTELESAIISQDSGRIAATLSRIDASLDQLIQHTGELGGRGVQLDFLELSMENAKLDSTEWLSFLEDADFADSVRRMTELENIYQSSLLAASKFMNISLVNFLR